MNCCPECFRISSREDICDCGTTICTNKDCIRYGKYYHYDCTQNRVVPGHDLRCPAYSDDESVTFEIEVDCDSEDDETL